MPSKHISERSWRMIEKETVRAVTKTQRGFKESEVLEILIKKGLENITIDDYIEATKKKT